MMSKMRFSSLLKLTLSWKERICGSGIDASIRRDLTSHPMISVFDLSAEERMLETESGCLITISSNALSPSKARTTGQAHPDARGSSRESGSSVSAESSDPLNGSLTGGFNDSSGGSNVQFETDQASGREGSEDCSNAGAHQNFHQVLKNSNSFHLETDIQYYFTSGDGLVVSRVSSWPRGPRFWSCHFQTFSGEFPVLKFSR